MNAFYIVSTDGRCAVSIGPFDSKDAAQAHIKECTEHDAAYADNKNEVVDAAHLNEATVHDHMTPAEDLEFAACGFFSNPK